MSCFLISYNLFFDPYGVFSKTLVRQVSAPNENFIKSQYILNNKNRYNAFLFGNSRVAKINVDDFNGNYSFYNMTSSEAVPYENLKQLELFLSSGVEIKRVVIGLDEISCFISPKKHHNEPLRKVFKNKFFAYIYYLYLKPSLEILKIYLNYNKDPFWTNGYYSGVLANGSNGFKYNKKDAFIDSNINIHINDSIFNSPYWSDFNSNKNIESSINSIKAIIDLCNENNISVTFFINPIYIKTYEKALESGFGKFLQKLSLLTDFYNFNIDEKITSNKINYYENSHYRPNLGNLIVNELNKKSSFYQQKVIEL